MVVAAHTPTPKATHLRGMPARMSLARQAVHVTSQMHERHRSPSKRGARRAGSPSQMVMYATRPPYTMMAAHPMMQAPPQYMYPSAPGSPGARRVRVPRI